MGRQHIAQHFHHIADGSERLGSPFTAKLCRLLPQLLDETTQTGRLVLDWPGNVADDALALRLCGGLHALVLSKADRKLAAVYPPHVPDESSLRAAVAAAIERHDAALVLSLPSPPQTNEVGRAAMLLPGFILIGTETGMPLRLHEIGASAGLNLFFDRFFYRYGEAIWGDAASPVHLMPEVRGKAPPLGGFIDVVSRKACDTAPLDVTRADDRLRLKSYVWADQPARLERLDGAMRIARQARFVLERTDAVEFVAEGLRSRSSDCVFVLFHSIMWQYMPQEKRRRIEDMLDTAGNAPDASPIAWLRMEPIATTDPHATLRLTLWPGGETHDLAHCDYHGRWIAWLGS